MLCAAPRECELRDPIDDNLPREMARPYFEDFVTLAESNRRRGASIERGRSTGSRNPSTL